MLDVSARTDGSSRFGENNRYANFWSFGAMWQLKGENFLKDVKWINGLSLKYSTGISGNAEVLNDYMYLPKVGVANITYGGRKGYNLSDLGNSDLQWQKQLKHTFAVNAELFEGLQFSVDFYKRIIYDMIISVEIPRTTGFQSFTTNDMEFLNKGIDVSLSFTPIKGRKGYVSTWASFNYNREEIVSLSQNARTYFRDNADFLYQIGKPSTFYYPIFHQVNPQTRAPEWFVPNADVSVQNNDPNNVTSTFNSVALKQNTDILKNSPINGGLGFNGSYGDISFQLYFSYSLGKYMINQDRFFTENPANSAFLGADNQSTAIFDYWKKTGDIARFPDPKQGHKFTQYDSRLIEDASYLRLRGITLTYSLPQKYVKEIGAFKNIRFFTSMNNVLTFTKFSGADPEIDAPASFGVNPSTRETTFGVDLKF